MLVCLKPAAFALVMALELESKGRYVMANMGNPSCPCSLGLPWTRFPPPPTDPSPLWFLPQLVAEQVEVTG